MKLQIEDFIPYQKNTLKGFFTIYFPDYGYSIGGFSLHENANARWVEVPSRPSSDQNAPKAWEKIIVFYHPGLKKRFTTAALKALNKYFSEQNQTEEEEKGFQIEI